MAAELPETTVDQACRRIIEASSGGSSGGTPERMRVVLPCDGSTLQQAAAIAGNEVVRGTDVNNLSSAACSFVSTMPDGQASAREWGARFYVARVSRSTGETLLDVLDPSFYGASDMVVNDFVVINDANGTFADALVAGSLNGAPISQGEPNPALGEEAIMFRYRTEGDTLVWVFSVVDGYDGYLYASTELVKPPFSEDYVPAPVQESVDKLVPFAEGGYSYLLSQQ